MAVTVMEKVPEAVEHYNRITTAIATYNLSKGNIVATVDAVQATQFNYDTGNRARLLKALPGGGGRALITPIMMFKTYDANNDVQNIRYWYRPAVVRCDV
jgi:membrane-bound lytic murein transglycosylase MltF